MNSEYNIMITNVSRLPKYDGENGLKNELKQYVFQSEEGEFYVKGYMTNEAPIYGLMDSFNNNNRNLDRIILIESDSVRNENIKIKVPAVCSIDGINVCEENSLHFLKRRIEEKNPEQDIVEVKIKDEPMEQDTIKCIDEIKKHLENVMLNNPETKINLFIEANGGVRYVIFMLNNIVNILERNNPEQIELKAIYNTVFDDSQRTSYIKNTKSIYESTELVSIIDEFINYGRVEMLKKYAERKLKAEGNNQLKTDILGCMKILEDFSQALQLCRTKKILELLTIEENGKNFFILSGLRNFIDKYNNDDSINSTIFKIIFEMICHELEKVYSSKETITSNNLDAVIKWCLDKNYVQQALTLCSEQIPKFLAENKVIKFGRAINSIDKENNYEVNYRKLKLCLSEYKDYIYGVIAGKLKGIELQEYDKVIADNYEMRKLFLNDSDGRKSRNINDIKQFICTAFKDKNAKNKLLNSDIAFSNGEKLADISGIRYSNAKNNLALDELFNIDKLDKNKAKEAVIERVVNIEIKIAKGEFTCSFSNEVIDDIWNAIDTVDHTSDFSKEEFRNYADNDLKKYKLYICCMDGKDFKTNISIKNMEKISFMYGLLKEQRNTVNHAFAAEDTVVLNMYELKNLMYMLVDDLRRAKEDAVSFK